VHCEGAETVDGAGSARRSVNWVIGECHFEGLDVKRGDAGLCGVNVRFSEIVSTGQKRWRKIADVIEEKERRKEEADCGI
jgi:hypothetical protein